MIFVFVPPNSSAETPVTQIPLLLGAERGARNSSSVASLSGANALSRRGSFEDQSWNRRRWGTQKIHEETNPLGGSEGFIYLYFICLFIFNIFSGGCEFAFDFFLEKLADTLPKSWRITASCQRAKQKKTPRVLEKVAVYAVFFPFVGSVEWA